MILGMLTMFSGSGAWRRGKSWALGTVRRSTLSSASGLSSFGRISTRRCTQSSGPLLGRTHSQATGLIQHSKLDFKQIIVLFQIWTGVPVPVLQLWTWTKIPTGSVPGLSAGDPEGLRGWSTLWPWEVLGLHEGRFRVMKQSLQTLLWTNYRIRAHCSAIKDFFAVLSWGRGAGGGSKTSKEASTFQHNRRLQGKHCQAMCAN